MIITIYQRVTGAYLQIVHDLIMHVYGQVGLHASVRYEGGGMVSASDRNTTGVPALNGEFTRENLFVVLRFVFAMDGACTGAYVPRRIEGALSIRVAVGAY